MQLVQYLMCVAARHGRVKFEHEEEISAIWERKKKSKNRQTNLSLTYDDDEELVDSVINSISGKPLCLKKLSHYALVAFAYILKQKIGNEPYIEGHQIIEELVCDPENTIDYLNGITELVEQEWIQTTTRPGAAFADQLPYCWLQSCLDFGEAYYREMGATQSKKGNRSFTSNDAYLDAVYAYLQEMIQDDGDFYQISEADVDLGTFQPKGWYQRITKRAEQATCPLPAAASIKQYSLSCYQHLALAGLLGMRDGDIRYDFSDPANVTSLFAKGRVCRKLMHDHLYEGKSQLIRCKLLEGTRGSFGEMVQITQLGVIALHGSEGGKITIQELQSRVKKNTLFDIEEPKIPQETVQLPSVVMEAIRALIFSETAKGKRIRKLWHSSLPAAWGAPSGSTLLLYGPPGTGKTLTAQYLASELQLPLLKIDAARVLSCWVGESEQNVRRIFDDYTNLQKELGKSPVLLFNEADQLLGSRDAGHSSVDRMNNNMQNLFLEGLERFSGILVATTNRKDLLDEAFSRRFTYKLELPAPDKKLRMELWKLHLPLERIANDVDIGTLADLKLSGGEIRLVIERAVRLLSYRGKTKLDSNTLIAIAKEELAARMKRHGSIHKIGFNRTNNE